MARLKSCPGTKRQELPLSQRRLQWTPPPGPQRGWANLDANAAFLGFVAGTSFVIPHGKQGGASI